jgi:hypothetical protein
MPSTEPVQLTSVPPPGELCPKDRSKDYYLIAEDLLEREILFEKHEKLISFFCKMLDQYQDLYEHYLLINTLGERRDRRKAKRLMNKSFQNLKKWSTNYFIVEPDYLRKIGVNIPKLED